MGPDKVGAKMQAISESMAESPSVARYVFSKQCVFHIFYFIYFSRSVNISRMERHIEDDEIRVDSQSRPAGCQ